MKQRDAVGKLVHGLAPWTWWGTLTFRYAMVEEHAFKIFRRWLRVVAKDIAQRHVPVAWALECGDGLLHYHVLLALPSTFDSAGIRRVETRWKTLEVNTGNTQFKKYDETKGAAWYLTKTNRWDFNVACSRDRKCRKGRCVAAPSPL
jgi:hypothetical protein